MRASGTCAALTLLLCFASTPPGARGEEFPGWVAFTVPAGPTESRAEVELLPWAGGEGAGVVARVAPPGRVAVPAGRYAVRLAGTDYRHGPVDVRPERVQTIALASLAVTLPQGAAPTAVFLLDARSRSLAVRVPAGGEHALALPGEHLVWRDQSEVGRPLTLAPGGSHTLALGAVAIRAPTGVTPSLVFFRDEADDTTAAVGELPGPPTALLPGRYRVRLQGSGVGPTVDVDGDVVVSVPAAAVVVQRIGAESQTYVVVDPEARAVALRAVSGPEPRALLLHGGPLVVLAEPLGPGVADLLGRAPRLSLRAGERAHLWLGVDGSGLAASGDMPVRVRGAQSGSLVLERPYAVEVGLAEGARLTVSLQPLAATTQPVRLGAWDGLPPAALLDIAGGAADLEDGIPVVIAVEAALADGAVLAGQSEGLVVRRVHLEAVTDLSAEASSPTSVFLDWSPVANAAGYNVYRHPRGSRPVNGSVPLASPGFTDLARSAGQAYEYQVTVVDARGLEGRPGTPARVTTPR